MAVRKTSIIKAAAATILKRLKAERQRNRLLYAGLVVIVIISGLASRTFANLLTDLLHKNAGDILWALMVFLLWGLLFPRLSTLRIVVLSLAFSLCIEVLKFYQAPWLDAVRATTGGRLIFGYVLSWSNLLCYGMGILFGAMVELWRSSPSSPPVS